MTRTQAEEKVKECIREVNGRLSIFWVMEYAWRACACERLKERGEIDIEILGYPYWQVTIKGE